MTAPDLFVVPTATFKELFVLVLLSHHRRRILHCNVTEHPTAVWAARQLLQACGIDEVPRCLIRDRDAIYGETFHRQARVLRIEEATDGRNVQPLGQVMVRELKHVGVLHHQYVRMAAWMLTDE